MKKGVYRTQMKRVAAAPNEIRCGVQCTLLVAAWSLFLFLLLTSSISHTDELHNQGSHFEKRWRALFWSKTSRQIFFGPDDAHMHGDQRFFIDDFEEFRIDDLERDKADKGISPRFAVLEVADTQEPSGGGIEGRHSVIGDCGETTNVDSCSLSFLPESDEDVKESVILKSNANEEPNSSNTLESETINALQYAEYGAGLLQKSGAAEGSSKKCLIGNPSGIHCCTINHHGEFTGQKCILPQLSASDQELPCPNEFLGDEHCGAALSCGGDVFTGESYLVCRNDFLTGSVFCELVCSSQSECFLSGVDSKLCHYDGSIRNVVHQSCQTQQGVQKLEVNPGVSSEAPNILEHDPVKLKLASLSGAPEDEDIPSTMDVSTQSDSTLLNQEEVVFLGEIPLEVEKVEKVSDVEDGIQESSTIILLRDSAVDTERSVIVDIERNVDVDTQINSGADEEWFLGLDEKNDLPEKKISIQTTIGFEDRTLGEKNVDEEINALVNLESDMQEERRRLKRVGSVMSLDEYKRSILEKQKISGHQADLSSVQTHKIRHSDESYNYAAASHGAKVLASNKEAKGASHILVSDKDKYLRNPCGAEDKYVVLELSEETFVDTLVISNFEFHSSNIKDFELLGSPVYPAKEWISLGKFQAENVRHRQKFDIEDPKLVRYLMVKMLSHWGSEFFCTLSVVEVFGVDVIKNLLDDWIALEEVENSARTQGTTGHPVSPEESVGVSTGQQSDRAERSDIDLDIAFSEPLFQIPTSELGSGSNHGEKGAREVRGKPADELQHAQENLRAAAPGDFVQEIVLSPGGKAPGDSVLKILMQRVKALELNQTLFDLYLGDMNQKYKAMFSELDKDLALVTERLKNETILTASLAKRLADMELKRKEEKLFMEHQFALIARNFTDSLGFMRWQIQSMERREITAIVLALLCMILSGLLHLLACCIPRRSPTHDFSVQAVSQEIEGKLNSCNSSSLCHGSSTFVLYLGSGLTILVLSV